jgi:hypothetical protein
MNSTATPTAVEPDSAPIARADEQLAHAHEQITLANEELTRLSEQLAKMERDAARPPSSRSDPQPPRRRPALRVLVGLPLAACIVAAALVLRSSYGGGAKLDVTRWAPQLVSTGSLTPENAPPPAQPAPSIVQVAAAGEAPPATTPVAPIVSQDATPPATPAAPTVSQDTTPTAPRPPPTTPQDAMPSAAAALPDHTQLLQTIATDLANMKRDIEQLKANQQQTASDNSRAIEQIKASQEEMKRQIARISEQKLSKTPPPPMQPTITARKPQRRLYSPYERELPPIPRDWGYDEW